MELGHGSARGLGARGRQIGIVDTVLGHRHILAFRVYIINLPPDGAAGNGETGVGQLVRGWRPVETGEQLFEVDVGGRGLLERRVE